MLAYKISCTLWYYGKVEISTTTKISFFRYLHHLGLNQVNRFSVAWKLALFLFTILTNYKYHAGTRYTFHEATSNFANSTYDRTFYLRINLDRYLSIWKIACPTGAAQIILAIIYFLSISSRKKRRKKKHVKGIGN